MDKDVVIEITPSKAEMKQSQHSKASKANHIQEELMQMGFDIVMINKVIYHFNITSTSEGIPLLVKANGVWGHSFIPQVEGRSQSVHEKIISSAMTQVRTRMNQELCEICCEGKAFHRLSEIGNEEKEAHSLKEREREIQIEQNHIMIAGNPDDDLCGICMDDFVNPITLIPCNHKFCSECINCYLTNQIVSNSVEAINCPKAECPTLLTEEFILRDLPQDTKDRYTRYKTMNQIAKDPNKLFCPLCDSYGLLDPTAEKKEKSTVTCQNGHTFCACGRPGHEGHCYKESEELKNFIQKEKIKKCPKCGFLIKKNSGCNHMTCGNRNCLFEFCWICLKEISPTHYETGDCKGMQFIEENSLLFKARKFPCLFAFLSFCLSFLILFTLFVILVITIVCPLPLVICVLIFLFIDTDKAKKSGSHCFYLITSFAAMAMESIAYLSLYYLCVGIALSVFVLVLFFGAIYKLIESIKEMCSIKAT